LLICFKQIKWAAILSKISKFSTETVNVIDDNNQTVMYALTVTLQLTAGWQYKG